jgi:hypothetical protein
VRVAFEGSFLPCSTFLHLPSILPSSSRDFLPSFTFLFSFLPFFEGRRPRDEASRLGYESIAQMIRWRQQTLTSQVTLSSQRPLVTQRAPSRGVPDITSSEVTRRWCQDTLSKTIILTPVGFRTKYPIELSLDSTNVKVRNANCKTPNADIRDANVL